MIEALDVAKYMRRNVDLGQSVIFTEPTKKIESENKSTFCCSQASVSKT
jgi:hypothetical protein